MSSDNTTDEKEPKHQRRIRYKGTHPKTFKEKYKELQPEHYADAVAKVIQKGHTPAGMHLPICVKEILEFLQITPGQTGLDATLGYGGHTVEMIKCLNSKGRLYAIDVDSLELPRTKDRLERMGFGPEILQIKQMSFSQIDQIVTESGPFNFVLADLGVSSMQIDNPERGFSYKYEGPLDLRLNPKTGISAANRLKTISLDELQGMLIENADEPYSAQIARSIISSRKKGTEILTTTQLQTIIKDSLKTIPHISEDDLVKMTLKNPVSDAFKHCELISIMSLKYWMNFWKNSLLSWLRVGVLPYFHFIQEKTAALKNHLNAFFEKVFIVK
jgi:16S rRNA (cytosine1402-N4)-methyltransferase